jgi:hypothetical protein
MLIAPANYPDPGLAPSNTPPAALCAISAHVLIGDKISNITWGGIPASFNQSHGGSTQLYTLRKVYGQYINRGSSNCCASSQVRTVPKEMIMPSVTTRMEKTSDFTCFYINTGNIRTLVGVTVVA